jgi:phosphohistidine swiveling domain-containing protein
VSHYIDRLVAAPALHDKVEFEIVLSCYSFDLRERLAQLPAEVFSDADRDALAVSLRRLTNRIINNRDVGLWRTDTDRIEELQRRRAAVMKADLDTVSRIYWLLEDCKRYGTLPFAGLARAGFIATQMLRSLVSVGVLSADECGRFMTGLDSIRSGMDRDLRDLLRVDFLAKYGHLRPGTYDILSPRYDEAPDRYFEWAGPIVEAPAPAEPFTLSLKQMRAIETLLRDHELDHDVVGLFDFLEAGIRNREHAKFVFTRSLSDALSLFASLGAEHGFSVEEMSFADIACIRRLYGGSEETADVLAESIAHGRARYRMTRQLLLPPLITDAAQVWGFHQPASEPNFITQKETVGAVRSVDSSDSLDGSIILLPNADPGFDWIFSRNIAGFITAYGGANSHMAVRAGELGLPAVIGAGEPLYATWSAARRLRLDCLNRQVQVLA